MVDIVILSTYDTDGAGQFTIQVSRHLQKIGYTTKIVCVKSRSGEAASEGILDRSLIGRMKYRLIQEVDRRLLRLNSEYAFIHLRGLPDRTVLNSDVWPETCRLIICIFSSGMISSHALEKIWTRFKKPPVIFYGVDMNLYTGGCHYARDCIEYEKECAHCPAVPKLLHAKVKKTFQEKSILYRNICNHLVIACSEEQEKQMMRSTLFAKSDIRRLLMSVNESIYGRHESIRDQIRSDYGFSGRVLMIRSSSEPRKGCDLFVDAIKLLINGPEGLPQGLTVVAIGDHYLSARLGHSGVKFHSLGYISDENELSKLYSAADVFINSSLADSGPVMLAQSLMSGTPVVTNKVGLAMDLVENSINGYLTESMSAEGMRDALNKMLRLGDEALGGMRAAARKMAVERISECVYMAEIGNLTNELVG